MVNARFISDYLVNKATELTAGVLATISKKLRQALELELQQAALAEYYRAGAAARLPKDDPKRKRLRPILRDFLPSPIGE